MRHRVATAALAILAGACARVGFEPPGNGGEGDLAAVPDTLRDAAAVDARTIDVFQLDAPWDGFSLFNFERRWATANSISWLWQCDGLIPTFDRYELCYATSAADLQTDQATCLTPSDDLALGVPDCGGGDLWHPTTAYGLAPATAYHAQLRVFDSQGQSFGLPASVDSTTALPAGQTVIFDEDLLPGVWLLELERRQENPRSGSWALVSDISTDGYVNLHYGGMSLSFPGMTEDRFESAYVEFYLDAPQAVLICTSFVGGGTASYCGANGYATIDGKPGYQQIQVPLSKMRWEADDTPLSVATLPKATKLQIGAEWGAGKVYLDEISIRY